MIVNLINCFQRVQSTLEKNTLRKIEMSKIQIKDLSTDSEGLINLSPEELRIQGGLIPLGAILLVNALNYAIIAYEISNKQ